MTDLGDALRALVARMRDERARWHPIVNSYDYVVHDYVVDEWADEIDAILATAGDPPQETKR
jgi:hypothetical protein